MADINFMGRLSNLWSGFVSLWISDVEKRHPEIAYQSAIDSMIEKYGKLKSATAAIMRRREEISARLESERGELAAISADLNAALATGQDELGIVLIQKKNALEASTKLLEQEMEQARTDAQEAKDSLIQVKAEIQKLKDEKDRMLAQMHSAQARLKIQNQLEGLSVDAEVRALDDVTIAFPRGQFTAVMGPSGSGKSTLLNCMAGLDRLTSGTVEIGGVDLRDLSDRDLTILRRTRLGFIFQSFNLLPALTARENITYPLDLSRSRVDPQWFDELIGVLGLRDRLDNRPSSIKE